MLACIDRLPGEAKRWLAHLWAMLHLKAIDDFAMMNRVWEAWLAPGSAPAGTTVEATLASPELLVEVTVIAAATEHG